VKTTITPTGVIGEDGIEEATMKVDIEVEVVATGVRREDGLTAAEVRQELKEKERNGS
jgi:hypothetical protein